MKKTDQHQTNIIRFNSNVKIDGQLFQFGQEWPFYDKYEGIIVDPECDGCDRLGVIYRVEIDGTFYPVPEIYVVEGTALNSVNVNQFNTTNTWDKKVTQDMIEVLGKDDYVKAAKIYLGRNIGAKKRQDQADYSSAAKSIY